MRAAGPLASLAVMLAACLSPAPSPQTWVGVYGPQDWSPPEEMRLEVSQAAWRVDALGGGGVVTPKVATRSFVRLIEIDSCRTYASFEADPGSAHTIRFADDGSVAVTEITGQPTEMGPALVEAEPTNCPRG